MREGDVREPGLVKSAANTASLGTCSATKQPAQSESTSHRTNPAQYFRMTVFLVTCRKVRPATGELISIGVVPEHATSLSPFLIAGGELGELIRQGHRFVIRRPGEPEVRLQVRQGMVSQTPLGNDLRRLPECTD